MRISVLAGLAVMTALVGCRTRTVDELSYSEQKALAGQIVQRCKAQNVPEAEMQACIDAESRREASLREREVARRDAIRAGAGARLVANMMRPY